MNFDLTITPKDEPVNVDKSIIEDGEKENVSTNNVGDTLTYQVDADIPHMMLLQILKWLNILLPIH